MEIWLKQDDKELRLPVLPAEFDIERYRLNTEVNITNLGIINLIGKAGLQVLTLESFFPAKKYPFVQYSPFPKPKECKSIITSMMKKPVSLIITKHSVNMLVTIESFTHGEKDGTGDIYYTLELKQYRVPEKTEIKKKPKKLQPNIKKKPKKLQPNIKKKTEVGVIKPLSTGRQAKEVKNTTYVVKKGDTLSAIAKKVTGNAINWRFIYEQNKKVIGSNPNKIYPGQKLFIKVG